MHVLSFNILVLFTWFTKDDRCLIKGLWTEKRGPTPNKRVSEQEVVPVNVTSIKCLFKQEQPRVAVVTRKWRAAPAAAGVSSCVCKVVVLKLISTN